MAPDTNGSADVTPTHTAGGWSWGPPSSRDIYTAVLTSPGVRASNASEEAGISLFSVKRFSDFLKKF